MEESLSPSNKKQKLEKGGVTTENTDKMKSGTDLFQCGYFLKKKNRYCKMHRKQSARYCPEHIALASQDANDMIPPIKGRKRVPCPMDPSHTIWEDNLKKHLSKCNKVRLMEVPKKEIYYKENINCTDIHPKTQELLKSKEIDTTTSLIDEKYSDFNGFADKEFYDYWIPIINKTYHNLIKFLNEQSHISNEGIEKDIDNAQQIKLEIKNVDQDTAIAARFDELTNHKHIIQQSSIIGYLKEMALYGGQFDYIEYGCGRAELSRYVCKDIIYNNFENSEMPNIDLGTSTKDLNDKIPSFLLIDRSSARLKMDSKMIKDFNECCKEFQIDSNLVLPPAIQRIKIDIKDLYLDKILDSPKYGKKRHVAISKHLCGCATDLTLHSLLNSKIIENSKFAGLLVAMCCRHVCIYDYLLDDSKRFLDLITQNSGSDKNQSLDKIKSFFKVLTKVVSWSTCGRRDGMKDEDINNHPSNMPILQREKLGLRVKRIIDESRLFAINNTGFLQGRIVQYVSSETSLENIALIVTPK